MAANAQMGDATKAELWYDRLTDWVETRTGVERRKMLTLIVAGAVLAYLMGIGHGSKTLSNLIGLAYPAYVAVVSTLSSDADALPIRRTWPTYWVTFSAIMVAEQPLGPVLQLFPFYWNLRAAFLVWCYLPVEANGTKYIHTAVVRRYIAPYVGTAPPAGKTS